MVNSAPQIIVATVGETLQCAANFTNRLGASEVLTGTPTITPSNSNIDVATSDIDISTTAMVTNGTTAAAGQVITWLTAVTTDTTGGRYDFLISAASDASQAFVVQLAFEVEATT